MADPRFPDEDTRSYPRPPAPPGPPLPYGPPPDEPRKGGSGWMIAFLVLAMLVVAAVLIWFFAFRDSGGPAGTVELTPQVVDFGDQDLGKRSAVQTVTLRNGTDGDVTLGTIAIGGDNADDFLLADETTCRDGQALLHGETCTIGVQFKPTKREDRAAVLSVAVGGGESHEVQLKGTGVGEARVVLETTRLEFGSVLLGKTRTLQLTLTNAGNAPLTISSLKIGGDPGYKLAKATTCSTEQPVKAGESCVLAVAFTPKKAGAAEATLSVSHDAAKEPAKIALRGTGKGTAALTADQSSLDFGDVEVATTSGPQTITLTNAGNVPVQLPQLRLAGDFALDPGSTCKDGLSLAPGATCTLAIVFAPSGLGSQSATFSVDVAGGTGTGDIALAGRGIPATATTTG